MAFKPQNILNRVKAGGFSLDNAVSELQSKVPDLKTPGNIDINGTLSGVSSQAQAAVNGAVQQIAGKVKLPSGLDLIGLPGAGGLGSLFGGGGAASSINQLGGTLPFKNQLESFASYNYIFTLGCLTPYELAYPDLTYRVTDPEILILKSGGGAGAKKVRTAFETAGSTEYFIDNVEIKAMITPNEKTRSTNALSINFEVLEPYSMGMFLQTLNLAAKKAGYENYIGAPYVLSVEFAGFDDNGNYMRPAKARRIFPLNFINTQFNVQEGGSTYSVQAIPYHETAFSDEVQKVKTDISLSGTTVGELLQSGPGSLATVLNDREVRNEEAKQVSRGDQFVISFPADVASVNDVLLSSVDFSQGATTKSALSQAGEEIREFTDEEKDKAIKLAFGDAVTSEEMLEIAEQELQKVKGFVLKRSDFGEKIRDNAENEININTIGASKIVKSFTDGGEVPFGRPKFTEVKDKPGVFSRGSLTISDEGRKFTFAQGTKIQDIIEEIVILSEYGRKLAENANNPDANGMIDWYRVEANVYIVDEPGSNNKKGSLPKVYVYQVVPFKVHVSKVANRNSATPGYPALKRQACKEYNYIYTGLNKDILEFDIDINYAFFMALNADLGQLNADSKLAGQGSSVAGDESQPTATGEGNEANSEAGTSPTIQTTGDSNQSAGGGGETHSENQVARQYNEAIVNSTSDLILIEFKIMGDPYYIADSGVGNYSAQQDPASINLTSDGTMEYQRGEVDITMNFRTPIDSGDPWMEFPGLGTAPVGAFSGLYQVLLVTNNFSGGVFTQTLKCIRRPNQETDTKAKPATGGNSAIKDGTQENNMNESTNASGDPYGVGDQGEFGGTPTGGGASQTNASGDPSEEGSTGSRPKPEETEVINRIRGTL